jgi:hypothetical protein
LNEIESFSYRTLFIRSCLIFTFTYSITKWKTSWPHTTFIKYLFALFDFFSFFLFVGLISILRRHATRLLPKAVSKQCLRPKINIHRVSGIAFKKCDREFVTYVVSSSVSKSTHKIPNRPNRTNIKNII